MNFIPLHAAIEELRNTASVRFFLDTCFVLETRAMDCLLAKEAKFLREIATCGSPIVLPLSVQREIDRLAGIRTDVELSTKAQYAQYTVETFTKQNLIRIVGDVNRDGSFADQTFLEIFTRFRPKYDLFLFTQDQKLAVDLLRLNNLTSINSQHTVWIGRYETKRIRTFNTLDAFDKRFKNHAPEKRLRRKAPTKSGSRINIPSKPRQLDNELIGGKQSYNTGDTLKTAGGNMVKLGKFIAKGGEGSIFELANANGFVAKVYSPDRRTRWREGKLKKMVVLSIKDAQISWPISLLYGDLNQFLGYVMSHSPGVPLQYCVFGRDRIKRHFPDWDRRHLVTVAHSIAKKVDYLHGKGVIVGDLNPMNFLVQDEDNVHLVDTDSVQIEDFPCPVGMESFKAPEIPSCTYEEFLRSETHENFALATLLFMILMGGKAPFSFQGGGDPAENIKARNFPYILDRANIPAGAYRFIWSYFPHYIKKAFADAFTAEDPKYRPDASQWIRLLKTYSTSLESDAVADSRALWPPSFKPPPNSKLKELKCDHCSSTFTTSEESAMMKKKFKSVLCDKCRFTLTEAHKKADDIQCICCHQRFQMRFTDFVSNKAPLRYCEACVQDIVEEGQVCRRCHRTSILPVGKVMYQLANGGRDQYCETCIEELARQPLYCENCGWAIPFTKKDVQFYLKKGYNFPKRCKACREEKKGRSHYY